MIAKIILPILLCAYFSNVYAAENPYVEQQKKEAAAAQAQNSKQLQETFSKNTEETKKELQPKAIPDMPAQPAQPAWERAIAPKNNIPPATPIAPTAPVTTSPTESTTEPSMPPNLYR
jgi:hypothetical protein